MYAPAYARVENEADALAMVRAQPFATLVVAAENRPVLAYAPFVRDPQNERVMIGHVARANPVWQAIGENSEAVLSFRGADAYVSPSLYPSKFQHGRVVPTWNYLAVEIRGAVRIETDSARMRAFVEAITQAMEMWQKYPWHVSDAPDDYVAQLCKAIVGVRVEMSEISAVRKLSQNKTTEDFEGVVAGLSCSSHASAQEIASAMRTAKPIKE